MPSVTTPPQEVLCANTQNTALWNPMTAALATSDIKDFRVQFWFAGLPAQAITVEPALQFSNDGITWDSPVAVVASPNGTFAVADGWVFDAGFGGFASLFPDTYGTPRLFVRFGANFTNTSDNQPVSFLSRVRVEVRPLVSSVNVPEPIVVYSNSSTTGLFVPVTDWLPSEDVGEARISFEVLAIAGGGDIEFQGGYQTTNVPIDPSEWIPSTVTSGAIGDDPQSTTYYGTTFTTIPQSGDNVTFTRLGIIATNDSSSDRNAACVGVRVEYRQ